ncbi:hypothetical protein N7474_004996 [Penicillium riverlandense]|uniref:uncharacterized protein n=1 Tax=Penicillium riverlandense TaxID=1903569 RepID=UPI0025495837|nr:uncharacterized protein N7474_004996 [Penicillium riverlandense]KAJ5819405.1 hypothetical protein N7474_004996 [Penicillium riverlandense]
MDASWKFEPALGFELSRTATALGRLAPAIHALEKSDVMSLLRDLQRVRNDNAYLVDLIHKQQRTMERQAQESAILSQELARAQSMLAQKWKSNVSGSKSPTPSSSPTPGKALD